MQKGNDKIEVLIVEDDLRIADINRRFTEKVDGFTVLGTAATGEEAKDWLEAANPDLVLLDVYLPDMKGVDLVWHIRKHHRDTDIIMITAAGEAGVVQDALRGGVFDYIVKPLVFERFKQGLEKYKEYRQRLMAERRMDQQQIDRIWHRVPFDDMVHEAGSSADGLHYPKGIDSMTLKKVEKVLKRTAAKGKGTHEEEGVSAEMISREIGASRSTARRYLEYLASVGYLRVDVTYGTIGRPERRYFLKRE